MYKKYYSLADLSGIISAWNELLVYTACPSGALLAVHFPTDCVHLSEHQGASSLLVQKNGDMFYLKEPPHDPGSNYRFSCVVTNGACQKKIEISDGNNVITMILRN